MFEPTPTQRELLKRMRRYRIVAQLDTGAVVVVSNQQYHTPQVIDVDGQVYSLSRYLAILDRRV